MPIPEGYEINTDDDYVATRGEDYYLLYGVNFYVEGGKCMGLAGMTIKQLKRDYNVFLIKKKKILSPEDKEKELKKKARDFVNKRIKNPTEEIYLKYETVFLREDKFGL